MLFRDTDHDRLDLALPSSLRQAAQCSLGACDPLDSTRRIDPVVVEYRTTAVVREQRCWALLAAALGCGCVVADDKTVELVQREARRSLAWSLTLERRQHHLAARLADASIEFRVLKGATHADFYRWPAARTYSDLDLLVRSSDFQRAVDVIEAGGAKRINPKPTPGFVLQYGKGVALRFPDRSEVDLHRALAEGPFGASVAEDDLFDHLRPPPPSFATHPDTRAMPEDSVATVAVTAAIHAVLPGDPRRLFPLLDVAAIAVVSPVPSGLVIRRAQQMQASLPLALAVSRANRVFGLGCHPLIEWADEHRPSRQQVRWLRAHRHRDLANPLPLTLVMLEAQPTVFGKADYAKRVLFHPREQGLPANLRSRLASRRSMNP